MSEPLGADSAPDHVPQETSGEAACPPRVAVIVPCFNEREGIARTIEELHQALAAWGPYELIVVDDASIDGSRELLREIAGHDPRVSLVEHAWNRGYGAALKTGMRRARSELLAIIDADGTYAAADLPKLLDLADRNDMVVGARPRRAPPGGRLRWVAKRFLKVYCDWLAGERIPDMNSGLRVVRRWVVERFLPILPNGFSFTTTLTLAMVTSELRVGWEEICYRPRLGKSKIRPLRDTLAFVHLMLRTAMYFAPLRVFGPLGGLLGAAFAASLGYDVFVLRDLTEKTLLLLQLALTAGMFALLADMINRRCGR